MIGPDQLSKQIFRAMSSANLPGLSLAIIENDTVVFDNVFGVLNKTNALPLTRETQFQAASLSKPVFAYLVLKLVEEGRLNLDKPLAHYSPTPTYADPRYLKITVRHVLTHRTGFPNWCEDGQPILEEAPGGRFGYSGEGFTYLQKVIEHLTEQPLHVYAQNQLFEPLEMHNSTFAWGLSASGDFLLDEDDDVLPPTGPLFSNAAFSLLTTASDYAKFILAMLSPQDNHPFRLNAATCDLMLRKQAKVGTYAALSWGLGWGIQQTEYGDAFWHWGGAQNNYFNYCFALPKLNKAVVVMTNDANGQIICDTVAGLALNLEIKQPAFEWIRPIHLWQARPN